MTEYKKNKIPKSEKTKQNIIDNYLNLIREKKWDKITVKELCIATGITRSTFYQYYFDIYDLMEQIQTELLEDITKRYNEAEMKDNRVYTIEDFEEDFDYNPPNLMRAWFYFCKNNKAKIAAMLDPKNGDKYFVNKLKKMLGIYVNKMMDNDGLPDDKLRDHFTKVFIEMHFLATRSWLHDPEDQQLSINQIVNILNTTRIGANYLEYRSLKSKDICQGIDFSE